MNLRTLGSTGLQVSALGIGCMSMTPIYAKPDAEEAAATLHAAMDAGLTLVDTADAYAGGRNEDLVGQAIAGRRDEIVLATKFGNVRLPDGTRTVNGKPSYVGEACENSLRRLGVECIDLYFVHRIDADVPIEDTVGAMSRLVEAGKVRYIGLSEAGAGTIRAAHSTHPISAVQTEYSLATRDVEADILPTCRALGIGFVAYAPLSRGLLTGQISNLDQLEENDRRRDMPRFKGDNLASNLAMVDAVGEIAVAKECSTACVALAWVLAQGDDIVPIPGCSRRATLEDCLTALQIDLTPNEIADIAAAFDAGKVVGTRYPEKQMSRLGI